MDKFQGEEVEESHICRWEKSFKFLPQVSSGRCHMWRREKERKDRRKEGKASVQQSTRRVSCHVWEERSQTCRNQSIDWQQRTHSKDKQGNQNSNSNPCHYHIQAQRHTLSYTPCVKPLWNASFIDAHEFPWKKMHIFVYYLIYIHNDNWLENTFNGLGVQKGPATSCHYFVP